MSPNTTSAPTLTRPTPRSGPATPFDPPIREFPRMMYRVGSAGGDGNEMVVGSREEMNDAIMAGYTTSRTGMTEGDLIRMKIKEHRESISILLQNLDELGEKEEGKGAFDSPLPEEATPELASHSIPKRK